MFEILFIILLIIVVPAIWFLSWTTGKIAYLIAGGDQGTPHYKFVGFIGLVVGTVIGNEIFESRIWFTENYIFLPVFCIGVATLIAFFQKIKYENRHSIDMKDDNIITDHSETQPNSMKEPKAMNTKNVNFKNLIRIPIWALYSLIVATVIITIVMLVNIWFPEAVDEEIIWKIVLSYGVFLVSALVISNLTDRIKDMRRFENDTRTDDTVV